MKTISFFALTALLFLVSCNKDDDQIIVIDETFELDYRTPKTIEGTNFSITFENLVEDSRCPTDVICGWEGRAIVEIKIQENEVISLYQLATYNSINLDSLLAFQHQDYNVKLIEVNPIPLSTNQTATEDYSLALEITEK